MIGTWHALVLDCKDPDRLATFYQEVLGMIRVQEDENWITIGDAADRPGVAFQRVEDYTPPDWPGQELPQQAHLDIRVADLDVAESEVLALGATATDAVEENFRVYLDPQGHPFCLVSW